MGESFMTVIMIGGAIIIIVVFPLMIMANQTDEAANLMAQTAVTEFGNDVIITGVLSGEKYDNLIASLPSGNVYNVELAVQVADGNLSKKEGDSSDKIYYTLYDTQVKEKMYESGLSKRYTLKEGDIIFITVQNANPTISQQIMSSVYKFLGKSSSTITAQYTGMVTRSGN